MLFSSAIRGLNTANRSFATSAERLATGLRINRGSDDPSGLIASEFLGAQGASLGARVRVLDRATLENNIAEGTLDAAGSTISGISAMVVQSANSGALGAYEQGAIRTGLSNAVTALNGIIAQSDDPDLLDDVTVQKQVGTDGMGDPIYETYNVNDLPELAESDPALAQELVGEVQTAIVERRAEIGAQQRSDEAVARATETEAINTAAARSSIRDADYAAEAVSLSRSKILSQSSIQVLRLSQDISRGVLDLLA